VHSKFGAEVKLRGGKSKSVPPLRKLKGWATPKMERRSLRQGGRVGHRHSIEPDRADGTVAGRIAIGLVANKGERRGGLNRFLLSNFGAWQRRRLVRSTPRFAGPSELMCVNMRRGLYRECPRRF